MPAEWRNQVAVVTGGARGIGRATARLLAHHGAAVCVNYAVQSDAAEALVAEISTAGGRAIAVAADVAARLHRSKQQAYSITTSARASNVAGKRAQAP